MRSRAAARLVGVSVLRQGNPKLLTRETDDTQNLSGLILLDDAIKVAIDHPDTL